MTINEESTYNDQVYNRIAAAIEGSESPEALPTALQGAMTYMSPVEQLLTHAALGLLSLWEAMIFARTMSVVIEMGGDYILKTPGNLRRCVRAWYLWWIHVVELDDSTAPLESQCGQDPRYPRVALPRCHIHREVCHEGVLYVIRMRTSLSVSCQTQWRLFSMPAVWR